MNRSDHLRPHLDSLREITTAAKERAAFRARVPAVACGEKSPAGRQRPAPPTVATPTPTPMPPELPKITGETIRRRR